MCSYGGLSTLSGCRCQRSRVGSLFRRVPSRCDFMRKYFGSVIVWYPERFARVIPTVVLEVELMGHRLLCVFILRSSGWDAAVPFCDFGDGFHGWRRHPNSCTHPQYTTASQSGVTVRMSLDFDSLGCVIQSSERTDGWVSESQNFLSRDTDSPHQGVRCMFVCFVFCVCFVCRVCPCPSAPFPQCAMGYLGSCIAVMVHAILDQHCLRLVQNILWVPALHLFVCLQKGHSSENARRAFPEVEVSCYLYQYEK